MVIIAIGPFNVTINLKQLVSKLAPTIKEQFQALNFKNVPKGKLVYLELLGKNPKVHEVIERLNNKVYKKVKLSAFIPKEVPQNAISNKPVSIPTKLRRNCKIPAIFTDDQIRKVSMDCFLIELQTKFTGLFDLSESTGHKLLEKMAQTIYDRICEVHQESPVDTCFKLTSFYRRRYPHYTDFQFIQSTLHDIQDAQGAPRLDIDENELCAVAIDEFLGFSFEHTQQACNLNINWISKLLNQHVKGLTVNDGDSSPEGVAKMTVRKHLKKMAPHISGYVRQVIINHILPARESYYVVKVYGEPYLPNKTAMLPFTQQFRTVSTIRSEHMYNHISLKVPWMTYLQLLKSDGQNIENAKLVIRPVKSHLYKIKRVMTHSSLRQSDDEVGNVVSGDEEVGDVVSDDEKIADDAEHSDVQEHGETENMEWSEDW
ncbi:uncharacterized protein LOC112051199 [Bicyclus anynana]|uniref:Uncharacterized protein LOC112051199 n=1 Tax=Bicyclus anynana TaxID=110368 RepID=A0A6J1NKP8_BICAN|nr:uncharacterized protein LOC112051199 [Bicyclus anynana]